MAKGQHGSQELMEGHRGPNLSGTLAICTWAHSHKTVLQGESGMVVLKQKLHKEAGDRCMEMRRRIPGHLSKH